MTMFVRFVTVTTTRLAGKVAWLGMVGVMIDTAGIAFGVIIEDLPTNATKVPGYKKRGRDFLRQVFPTVLYISTQELLGVFKLNV